MAGNSRNALIVLLAMWLGFIVLLPKYAANLGDNLFPLPSKKEFQLAIKKEVEKLKYQAIILVQQIKDMERYINQFVRVHVQNPQQ